MLRDFRGSDWREWLVCASIGWGVASRAISLVVVIATDSFPYKERWRLVSNGGRSRGDPLRSWRNTCCWCSKVEQGKHGVSYRALRWRRGTDRGRRPRAYQLSSTSGILWRQVKEILRVQKLIINADSAFVSNSLWNATRSMVQVEFVVLLIEYYPVVLWVQSHHRSMSRMDEDSST